MKMPDDMDAECVPICEAMNRLPGIETTESCQGHGHHGMWIFFRAETVEALRPILTTLPEHSWSVKALWHNGSDTIGFWLKGPSGLSLMSAGQIGDALSRRGQERSS